MDRLQPIRSLAAETAHRHFVYFVLVSSDQLVPDLVSHICALLCDLFARDNLLRWAVGPGVKNFVSVDETCRIGETVFEWPYSGVTRMGITETGRIDRWRVRFSGIEWVAVGYLYLGVVSTDELSIVEYDPRSTLIPAIARPSRSHHYDVIVDTRPGRPPQMHIIDLTPPFWMYLYCAHLNLAKLPSPENPLLLVVFSQIPMQVTLESFASGTDVHHSQPAIPLVQSPKFKYKMSIIR